MDKGKRKIIRDRIDKSTVPDEIKLMYAVASACQSIVEHCDTRIRNIFTQSGVKTAHNDLLSGLNEYCKNVKMASSRFYNYLDKQIIGATYDIGGAASYDGFNGDVAELVQLMMLYVDRTARDKDKAQQVFDLLAEMPSLGIFKEEDIKHFVKKD